MGINSVLLKLWGAPIALDGLHPLLSMGCTHRYDLSPLQGFSFGITERAIDQRTRCYDLSPLQGFSFGITERAID